MSKFKGSTFQVGDKVRVKYIPNVDYDERDMKPLEGIKTISCVDLDCYDGPYKLAKDEMGWNFSDDSLELVEAFEAPTPNTTQRTLLGLETEMHTLDQEAEALVSRIKQVRSKIQKLREMEE